MANRNYDYTKFDEKYDSVLDRIGLENPTGENQTTQISVARDMFIDMVDKKDATIYRGLPADFDFEEAQRDLAAVRAQFK
ncbi:hypothetical protein [Anaerovorax sp. IOR16]|uniref:hypothetical protein n=1 Tax=Anaerovorax sp. IOR16 TaxID=2773458 RepID=UPI0019D201D5|nr:hypothetical protein [Anaerovorax sp. IOR16]